MNVILRPARPEDAEALARLGAESFVAKFGHLYREADLAAFLAEAHSLGAASAEILHPDRIIRLAEAERALLGYCKLSLVPGFPEHARGARTIELKGLYTDPARTGQGIGGHLIDWALAEARLRGFDEMQLSVWSGNEGAQRFYARHGFAKVADVTFRVGEQIDHEFLFARML